MHIFKLVYHEIRKNSRGYNLLVEFVISFKNFDLITVFDGFAIGDHCCQGFAHPLLKHVHDDCLELLLSFDLLIEDSKSYVFEVGDG